MTINGGKRYKRRKKYKAEPKRWYADVKIEWGCSFEAMNKETRELLEECRDTFEWIVDCEYWECIEEYSSAEDMMTKIDNILQKEEK